MRIYPRVIFGKANKSLGYLYHNSRTRRDVYMRVCVMRTMCPRAAYSDLWIHTNRTPPATSTPCANVHTTYNIRITFSRVSRVFFVLSFAHHTLCTWIFVSNVLSVRVVWKTDVANETKQKNVVQIRFDMVLVPGFRVRCGSKKSPNTHWSIVSFCVESWWVDYFVTESD